MKHTVHARIEQNLVDDLSNSNNVEEEYEAKAEILKTVGDGNEKQQAFGVTTPQPQQDAAGSSNDDVELWVTQPSGVGTALESAEYVKTPSLSDSRNADNEVEYGSDQL